MITNPILLCCYRLLAANEAYFATELIGPVVFKPLFKKSSLRSQKRVPRFNLESSALRLILSLEPLIRLTKPSTVFVLLLPLGVLCVYFRGGGTVHRVPLFVLNTPITNLMSLKVSANLQQTLKQLSLKKPSSMSTFFDVFKRIVKTSI